MTKKSERYDDEEEHTLTDDILTGWFIVIVAIALIVLLAAQYADDNYADQIVNSADYLRNGDIAGDLSTYVKGKFDGTAP